VSAAFNFADHIEFDPSNADALLRSVPAAPGVFALRGADPTSEPYLTRAADLRRRLRRLLAPPEQLDASGQPVPSKRLNLRNRVRFIEYNRTGSDFESALLLYHASRAAFGAEEARRRLRLHTPYFLRVTMTAPHPRAYSTNRLSKKTLAEFFGPFPSRAAADRYCDAVLDLFKLRRCYEDLHPYPEHPGCVYGDIKKCIMPCKEGNPTACTPAEYTAEASRVFAFFRTRGQSLLDEVAAQRDAADELVRPIPELRAVILQQSVGGPFIAESFPAMSGEQHSVSPDAAVFLLTNGHLCGPARLSTLGVRAVREQTAVGSSLFAQPLMLAPVPIDDGTIQEVASAQTPEDRARAALDQLTALTATPAPLDELCDALSLFRRWYYRPEKQRAGEVFVPNPDGGWPIRRILNGAARVVLGPPAEAPPVDRETAREAAREAKRQASTTETQNSKLETHNS